MNSGQRYLPVGGKHSSTGLSPKPSSKSASSLTALIIALTALEKSRLIARIHQTATAAWAAQAIPLVGLPSGIKGAWANYRYRFRSVSNAMAPTTTATEAVHMSVSMVKFQAHGGGYCLHRAINQTLLRLAPLVRITHRGMPYPFDQWFSVWLKLSSPIDSL